MADLAGVKRKVAGLLALAAPGSGATAAERSTAKALADQLTAKYGIDPRDCQGPQPSKRVDPAAPGPVPGQPFVWPQFDLGDLFTDVWDQWTSTTGGTRNLGSFVFRVTL